jgi:hypothetical protein
MLVIASNPNNTRISTINPNPIIKFYGLFNQSSAIVFPIHIVEMIGRNIILNVMNDMSHSGGIKNSKHNALAIGSN